MLKYCMDPSEVSVCISVAVETPTGRLKSVRNRFVVKVFVLSFAFLNFLLGEGLFSKN